MLGSMLACYAFLSVSPKVADLLVRTKVVPFVGDLSFGIYLSHMALVVVLSSVFNVVRLDGYLSSLLLWTATLVASAAVVFIAQRILPKRILFALGFM